MFANLPITLPDWLPPWALLLLALPVMLWILAFLLMPFSVFGVKGRLEALEGQIDAMRDELKIMQMRFVGALPADSFNDVPDFGHIKKASRAEPEPVPPVPPVMAARPMARPFGAPPPRPPAAPAPGRRAEPRLD